MSRFGAKINHTCNEIACFVKSGGAGEDAGAPEALSAMKPVSLL